MYMSIHLLARVEKKLKAVSLVRFIPVTFSYVNGFLYALAGVSHL